MTRNAVRACATMACAAALALLVACQAPERTVAVVEHDHGVTTGAVEGGLPPMLGRREPVELSFVFVPATGFAYRDASGAPTGVTVELLRDFARWLSEQFEVPVVVHWHEEPTWSDFYARVRDGQGGVFGVGNVTITQARWSELDFSPPYMNNIATLATHVDVPELASMERIGEAFAGMTGLVFPGTLHETRMEQIREAGFSDLQTRPVSSNDELIELLASGEGYFSYVDVYNVWRAEQQGLPLRRHPVADDASEQFGVILPDVSPWTAVIDAFFESDGGYIRSERFAGHLERHLGAELAGLLRPE